ncbi:ABC transporter ATP-binding protein/permease [Alphaproteobacteria bacterium]|nr:ABC transporter ATP-binding protein/permease [Alphaproteobacteria bacterium]
MSDQAAKLDTPAKYPVRIGVGQALFELVRYISPRGNREVMTRTLLALLFISIARASTLIVPLAYGWVVDFVSEDPFAFDISVMWWLLGAYALARVSQQFFDEGSEYVFVRVAQKAVHAAALKTFRHLHSLSLKFHLDRQTGGLTRAIERGAKGMEFLLTFALLEVMPLIIELILVSAILWGMFGFYYALVTVITVIIYATYTLTLTEWRIKFRRRMNDADEKAATRAVDSLLNYETVKYFNAEEIEAKRFSNALKLYEDAAVVSRTSLSMVNVGQGLIISIGLMIVMGLAGQDIKAGNLSIGSFVVVNTYLIQLYLPLNFLGYIYREIRQSVADMERMFSLLTEDPDIMDNQKAAPLRIFGGRIDFENITFSYGPRAVLKNLSFSVEAGKRVALVGPSGAGKSTISKLMFRFYDPDTGDIRIDGQSLRDLEQSSLRAEIAMVPQDTVLFNTTIAENIAYGTNALDMDAVRNAARLASLDDFISSLPDGYDTKVGERGLKLSGGEKQRVAIARAILKNPSIFLFDEATSALDSHTEKQIQQSLNAISEERTTLIIAHRLSTIVSCDEILVLVKGEIVERGTHKTLLAKKGVYFDMWQRQASESTQTIPS